MNRTIQTCDLNFKKRAIREIFSEQVCDDDRLALDVAKPLLDTGVSHAAITERKVYDTAPAYIKPCHDWRMLLQGDMRVEMNNRTYDLNPGDIMVAPAGAPYRITAGPAGIRWLYFWINDQPEWAPIKKRGGYVRPYESAALIYLLLRDVLDAKASHQPAAVARARIESRVLLDLLRLEMAHGDLENNPQSAALQDLVEAITEAPGKTWGRQDMAATLHLSVSQMTRIFQDQLGVSPGDFIIRQRMQIATQRLVNTNHKIKAIAEEAGYDSLHSFTRLFTKHVGMPPGHYRIRFGHAPTL